MRKRINFSLFLIILLLITLFIERNNPNSQFSFRNVKNFLFQHSNILKASEAYDSVFFPVYEKTNEVFLDSLNQKEAFMDGYTFTQDSETLYSLAYGVVVERGYNLDIGNYVIIKDVSGVEYTYGFLDKIYVSIYENVYKQAIGTLAFRDSYEGFLRINNED